MATENVLELKIVKMNDEYSIATITKQNDDVLERGEFNFVASNGLKIFSDLYPGYSDILGKKRLDIKGLSHSKDNIIIVIPNKDVPFIEKAVEELNKKYGIKKNWRAKEHENYYLVSINGGVAIHKLPELRFDFDNSSYQFGNYFRTEEQAEKCSRRIKKVIEEYHKEIGE